MPVKMATSISREAPSTIRRELINLVRHTMVALSCGSLTHQPHLDPAVTDPGLLRKHSTLNSYTTSFATYPSIRVFYRPHPQADKLPNKPTPLPLLVVVHGLGGSLAQFHPLLTSLVNIAPCLGIDLPGCGLSKFAPQTWQAYSIEALAELLGVIISNYCDQNNGQGVILVGHSMGCSLSALLSSQNSPLHEKVDFPIVGQIAICPKASRPTYKQVLSFRRLLNIPTPIFDMWRKWDRRGGTESTSVYRFVGRNADIETKKVQEKFNTQSQTAVWRRMAWGAVPTPLPDGEISGGLPGPELWAGISLPLFLVAGEADHITKSEEIAIISKALGKTDKVNAAPAAVSDDTIPQSAAPEVDGSTGNDAESIDHGEVYGLGEASTDTTLVESNPSIQANGGTSSVGKTVLKTTILPSPATHALLYDHATYRTLAGLIQTFLADHIDSRLSLGWQLQHLSTEGKWDVKNLAKWQAVKPVSEPIAGIFRAMKTLREIDESHSPAIFVKDWRDKIKAVIDISHESPVYDPRKLDEGGIQYHKFPTVSKIPPTPEEVKDFIALVDRLRARPSDDADQRLIGVHCHYGFNRTGFFICSYLIEREQFSVQRAIDEFQSGRPPGIRHEHFIDTLFVRYCIGLKRAPTL